ncbi:hypothetical protein BJX99DRAFT_94840 [Aspergillus californicus]
MYSFRHAASRLLASRVPLPVRSRLTPMLSVHQFGIRSRTFTQNRWVLDEAKSQLDIKDASSPTTTTATSTTTAPTDEEPSIEVEIQEVEELHDQPSEHGQVSGHVQPSEPEVDWSPNTTTSDTFNVDPSQIRDAAIDPIEAREARLAEKREMLKAARFEPKETVYVGNLFFDVTAEDLKQHMSQYGPVVRVNIIHDDRGISKGFGYTEFSDKASAKRAIEGMHLRIYEGRRVTVYYALTNIGSSNRHPKEFKETPGKTLYVGNMSYDLTDRDLNAFFEDLNNLIDVRVSVDRSTGAFRGFVHAQFTDTESATIAKEIISSRKTGDRFVRVSYARSSREMDKPRFGASESE